MEGPCCANDGGEGGGGLHGEEGSVLKAKAAGGGGMVVVQHCGENGVPGVRERKRDCEWDGKRGPVLLLHVLLRLLLLLCAPLCVLVSASLLLCERDGCAGGRSSRVRGCVRDGEEVCKKHARNTVRPGGYFYRMFVSGYCV